jgi:hypothetical protein
MVMTTKETERPLARADEPLTSALVPSRVVHYLVLGRKRDENGLPHIVLETTDRAAALQRCQDLNATDPVNKYKVETWTKMPRSRSE